jgi:hypothetical protein
MLSAPLHHPTHPSPADLKTISYLFGLQAPISSRQHSVTQIL